METSQRKKVVIPEVVIGNPGTFKNLWVPDNDFGNDRLHGFGNDDLSKFAAYCKSFGRTLLARTRLLEFLNLKVLYEPFYFPKEIRRTNPIHNSVVEAEDHRCHPAKADSAR